MKQTLLIILIILSTSCEKKVLGDDIKEAIELCSKNDGIKHINIYTNLQALIQCSNNAMMKIRGTEENKIDIGKALSKEKLDTCLDICSNNDGLDYITYKDDCIKWDGIGRGAACIDHLNEYQCYCKNKMFGNL